MQPIHFLLLFIITAFLNTILQLVLKSTAPQVLEVLGGQLNWFTKFFKIFINPYILSAILLLSGGTFLWFKIVAKVELSRAYPINIALTIIFTIIASLLLLKEPFTIFKAIGSLLIILGLFFIFK